MSAQLHFALCTGFLSGETPSVPMKTSVSYTRDGTLFYMQFLIFSYSHQTVTPKVSDFHLVVQGLGCWPAPDDSDEIAFFTGETYQNQNCSCKTLQKSSAWSEASRF